jgi:hypothetical protein
LVTSTVVWCYPTIVLKSNVIPIERHQSRGWSVTKTPNSIAEKGEAIYREKFQEEYERKYPGKFLAIDVTTATPYVADTPEKAVEQLLQANPRAYYHVIRVGSPGVYRVGYTQHESREWHL